MQDKKVASWPHLNKQKREGETERPKMGGRGKNRERVQCALRSETVGERESVRIEAPCFSMRKE